MVAYTGFRAFRNILTACLLLTATQAAADIWEEGDIEAGQALFNANCASCHKVTNEVLAAPGLAGIADRGVPLTSCWFSGFKTHRAQLNRETSTSSLWLTVTFPPTDG